MGLLSKIVLYFYFQFPLFMVLCFPMHLLSHFTGIDWFKRRIDGLLFSIVDYFARASFEPSRRALFSSLHERAISGQEVRILEIGPGTGANFSHYPKNTKLVTVELNPNLEKRTQAVVKRFPSIVLEKSYICSAEDMKPIQDGSFDIVVGTLVLCCSDTMKVLREVQRVLAPNGRFYYLDNPKPEPDERSLRFILYKLMHHFANHGKHSHGEPKKHDQHSHGEHQNHGEHTPGDRNDHESPQGGSRKHGELHAAPTQPFCKDIEGMMKKSELFSIVENGSGDLEDMPAGFNVAKYGVAIKK